MAFGRKRGGFTLVELVIAVAIIAIFAAIAGPGLGRWMTGQRVKSAQRSLSSAFSLARSEAIRTGNRHIVFMQTDAQGNPLLDPGGRAVPILVLQDSTPGAPLENCRIDAGETTYTAPAEPGVSWGVAAAAGPVATDFGTGPFAGGSSFTDPNGNPTTWVLFRPEGTPLAFDNACNLGAVGSGAGGVYISDGNRDYAVVVTPLGGVRAHGWEAAAGQWSN